MNGLLFGLGLLSLLALAFIAVPVLRFRLQKKASAELQQRRNKNLDLYEQRLLELDQEASAGVLEAKEAESIKTELQRAFLRDMQALENELPGQEDEGRGLSSIRLLPLISAVLVPLTALWLYAGWGAAPDLALPGLIENVRQSSSESEERAALAELAVTLQTRYNRHEDDIQNGYTLGSIYVRLEQFEQAQQTFASLVDKVESPMDQAAVLGQLAQAQFLANGEAMSAEVESTIQKALALNPNEQAIMSLLAVEAFLDQDVVSAVNYWRRQLSQLTPGSQEHEVLARRIALMESEFLAGEEAEPETESTVSITVNVDVTDEVRASVDSGMRVFVYARNPDSPMPMPVAARDFTVSDLPLTLVLDDSTPMMEGMPVLSSADRALVGARISKEGVANRMSGDYEAVTDPFELEAEQEISLLISEIVP